MVIKRKKPRVYLIGAGPGDPELLTVKAKKALKQAQVVIYDCLVSPDIIKMIRKDRRISAGRRKDKHSVPQEQVNELILENVMKGRTVVRLKGGDPSVFGRSGEEMDFLEKHGITCEIIPGITSAQAASSAAKIPLTRRGMSSSAIFCTGHPVKSAYVPPKNFRGTVVYYMAATSFREISGMFLKKGWAPSVPVVVVSNASVKEEKIYRLNLGDASKRKAPFISPATIIIGSVAGKH